jgi:hypothetical protein
MHPEFIQNCPVYKVDQCIIKAKCSEGLNIDQIKVWIVEEFPEIPPFKIIIDCL